VPSVAIKTRPVKVSETGYLTLYIRRHIVQVEYMTELTPEISPLALSILTLLDERPMHPYEMASTMRDRHHDMFIRLNFGTLYHTVDVLERDGWIVPIEREKEGRRPERTVYHLTEAGRARLDAWMSELIAEPVKEYPQFEAALSLLPVLHPDTVAELLRTRIRLLQKEIAQARIMLDTAHNARLPRLLLIEGEYHMWGLSPSLRPARSPTTSALRAEDGLEPRSLSTQGS